MDSHTEAAFRKWSEAFWRPSVIPEQPVVRDTSLPREPRKDMGDWNKRGGGHTQLVEPGRPLPESAIQMHDSPGPKLGPLPASEASNPWYKPDIATSVPKKRIPPKPAPLPYRVPLSLAQLEEATQLEELMRRRRQLLRMAR